MREYKRWSIIIDVICGLGVLFVSFLYYATIENVVMGVFAEIVNQMQFADYVSLVLAEFSTTFLIVSLLSMLSVRGQYIYWEEAIDYKIISPAHFNFISMSIYAFLSSLGSLIALFMEKNILIVLFFVLNVLILTVLTFRMTSVFFNKKALLHKFKKKIMKEAKKYIEKQDEKVFDSIKEKMNSLYENTYKLTGEKNYKEVIHTDLELIVSLLVQLGDEANEKLAKLYFSTMSRLFILCKDAPNYFLSLIQEKYRPFEESDLPDYVHTMIENALYNFFEVVMRENQYRVAYKYWITKIYVSLKEKYWNYNLQAWVGGLAQKVLLLVFPWSLSTCHV